MPENTSAGSGSPPLRIALTGSHGLIGSALLRALRSEGQVVQRIVRSRPEPGSDDIEWHPSEGRLDSAQLEGIDAVVHLAGESVGQRWTDDVKRRIRDSRVQGTRLLAETIARLDRPPRVLVSASAVGIYGDRGDAVLTEQTAPGADFLADVAQEWEAAAEPVDARGVRRAHPRFGVVLSPDGGALERMLLPFRLGVGGKIGSGSQWMSWVSLTDTVRALQFALRMDELQGPFNVVAPNPVPNAEFTRALGDVLGRPTLFTVPAAALRLAFGEMADAALLVSQRAVPERLLDAGFHFEYPELREALRAELGKAE